MTTSRHTTYALRFASIAISAALSLAAVAVEAAGETDCLLDYPELISFPAIAEETGLPPFVGEPAFEVYVGTRNGLMSIRDRGEKTCKKKCKGDK